MKKQHLFKKRVERYQIREDKNKLWVIFDSENGDVYPPLSVAILLNDKQAEIEEMEKHIELLLIQNKNLYNKLRLLEDVKP